MDLAMCCLGHMGWHTLPPPQLLGPTPLLMGLGEGGQAVPLLNQSCMHALIHLFA